MTKQRAETFRQGDVLVRRVDDRPRTGRDVREQHRIVLAHGEATGHAHEVVSASEQTVDARPAQFFEEPDGRRFLFIDRPCMLVHQEHGAIALAPGCYEVRRQREYHPSEIRNVAD